MSHVVSDGPSSESPDRAKNRSALPDFILRVLTWVFYAAFIILWFKDNIDGLKKYRASPLFALIPFLVIIGVRISRAAGRKKFVLRLQIDKTVVAILLLLFAATVVRWPYLMYGDRMTTSDDAIFALMGKHIAEGKLPPICYYGQKYMGSLSSHVYAFFFLVFGYSIPILKIATLLFYLSFIIIQFLLLKDVFSFSFAVVTSLLYSLPFGQLLLVSLDNSSAYGLVLFLGGAILFMATKVVDEKKTSWLPGLGFVMGLSFWTHQITISFILVAILLLIFKAHLGLRSYATLLVYGIIGGLPLVLQEVFSRFQLVGFLLGEKTGAFSSEKVKAIVRNLKTLLAPLNEDTLGTALILVFLLGVASLIFITVRSKGRSPASIFLLFLFIFVGMYWYSRFSDKLMARYLYPLYVCLPVFLLAPFYLFKSRLKIVFSAGFVAAMVMVNGWPVHLSYAADQKRESIALQQVVKAMRATGVKYWQADYWEAYALTAISKENPIVDAVFFNRYFPYRLAHYNQVAKDSIVFLRSPGSAEIFNQMLTALGIAFKRQVIGETSLFYDIEGCVFPDALYKNVPPSIPGLSFNGLREKNGDLEVSFRTTEAGNHSKFELNVEIPGYSRITTNIPDEAREFNVMIPAPTGKMIAVKYRLNYVTLGIPSSERYFTFIREGDGLGERPEAVVYLRGISQPISRSDLDARDCEQEAALEVRPPRNPGAKLRLTLTNPIDFRDMKWYGRYEQSVRITVGNSPPLEVPLHVGRNMVELSLRDGISSGKRILITLNFRYRWVFDAPTRAISALLENVEIIE